MQIVEYAKAHPWMTGAIIVIGGIVFISITGVFSGGASAAPASGGKSDAEIAANATIEAARINAQAAAAGYAAQIAATQAGYGYQLESDKLNAEVAYRQLEVNRDLGLAGIEADRQVNLAGIDAQKAMFITQSNNQVQTQQIIAAASKSKNKTSTIGGILGGAIGVLGGIFSDARLKQNVQLLGTNAAGLKVIEFSYKGSDKRYKGLVAQDVKAKFPDAVEVDPSTGFERIMPWKLPANARSLNVRPAMIANAA